MVWIRIFGDDKLDIARLHSSAAVKTWIAVDSVNAHMFGSAVTPLAWALRRLHY